MSERPAILIVGNFLSKISGARGVCEDLAEHLQQAGWQVCTTSNRRSRLSRLVDMLATAWRKRNEYQAVSIDTFSGLAFGWAEAVAWWLRRLGKPYALILHGGNLPEFARHSPRRVARLLNSAAIVCAPSAYLREQMRPYREDIRVVPNPIDLQQYTFQLRQQPQPNLRWLRAFHQVYQPRLAIQVAARLAVKYPGLQLAMAGGDKGDGSLPATRELAKALQVSEQVEFAGVIAHKAVPEWLQQGDIFINTSEVDNTPVSVLEAMACGLCVVSTNVGGIPYLLEDGQEALLAPAGDVEAMAAAIDRLLSEPGLAQRLSEKGRRKTEQFDWTIVLQKWEEIFYELDIRRLPGAER